MSALLLDIARAMGLSVIAFLATVGSWGLGFGVMTACTTATSSCSTTNAVLIGGWVLQCVLFAVALGTWLPPLRRRLRRTVQAVLALAVPLVAVAAFAGVAWVAERSYCRNGSDVDDPDDYCDVSAVADRSPSARSSAYAGLITSAIRASRSSNGRNADFIALTVNHSMSRTE